MLSIAPNHVHLGRGERGERREKRKGERIGILMLF
jgi:hypothetical protein